jgi:hypothetical protein
VNALDVFPLIVRRLANLRFVDYIAGDKIDISRLLSFISRTTLRLAVGQIIRYNVETIATL